MGLDQIAKIDRYTELQESSYKSSVAEKLEDYEKLDKDLATIIDFLWSDPRGGAGYGPSYRKSRGIFMFGPDVTDKFCKDNDLEFCIRSHEVKEGGWKQDHPKLYAVFSAPNYMDVGGNRGAYLTVANEDGKFTATPHEFERSEHPDVAPMIWQAHFAETQRPC